MSENEAFEGISLSAVETELGYSSCEPVSVCDTKVITSANLTQESTEKEEPGSVANVKNNATAEGANARNNMYSSNYESQEDAKKLAHRVNKPSDDSIETWLSYLVLAVCFATFAVSDGVLFLYGIMYQDLKLSFDTDTSSLALPFSVQTGVAYFGVLITSPLLKVLSLRAAGITGGLLAAVGILISSFAESLLLFTVTYGLVSGSGYAFLVILASIGVPFFFDRHLAVATGISNAGSSLGVFAMGPLIRYLIDKYTWRGCMLFQAGVVLQCVWLWMLVRPYLDKDSKNHGRNKREDKNTQHSCDQDINQSNIQEQNIETENKLLAALKSAVDFSLLKEMSFVLYMIVLFIAQLSYPLVYVFAPDKGTEMGFSKYETGWFVSCLGIGSLLGRILIGLVGNATFLQRRHVRLHSFCLALAGVSYIFLPSCGSLRSMYTIMVVCGFAGGGHIVMVQVVIVGLFGKGRLARSYCICSFVFGVGSLMAAPLSGFIRDNLNSYDPAFYLAGGQFFLAVIITFFVRTSDESSKDYNGTRVSEGVSH